MAWTSKTIREVALNILMLLVSIGVMLLIIEGALHFTQLTHRLVREGMPRHYYVADSITGYDLQANFPTSTHTLADGPYEIWTNEFGCFDSSYTGEEPYILLIGDSFTWGFSPFTSKWGTVLEDRIGIRVLKCGVPGYGTYQELNKARELLEIAPNPKLLVVGYYENDKGDDALPLSRLVYNGQLIKNLSGNPALSYEELMETLPTTGRQGELYCMWNEPVYPVFQWIKCTLSRNSILYVLARDAAKQLLSPATLRAVGLMNEPAPDSKAAPASLVAHRANIDGMNDLALQHDARLVFVLIPSRESLTTSDDPYAEIKAYLEEKEIAYIDLRPTFIAESEKGASLYWPRDLHWNEEGNRVAGEAVAAKLQDLLVR